MQDYASCFRDDVHVKTLFGMMAQDDVRFVPVEGTTNWGLPWFALFVQGEPEVSVLRAAAAKLQEMAERASGEERARSDRN